MPTRTINPNRTIVVGYYGLTVRNEAIHTQTSVDLHPADVEWLITALAGIHGHKVTIETPKVNVTSANQLQPGTRIVSPQGKTTIIVGPDPTNANFVVYQDGSVLGRWDVSVIVNHGGWWIDGNVTDPVTGFAKGDRVQGTPTGRYGTVARATPIPASRDYTPPASVSVLFDGKDTVEEVRVGLLIRAQS